MRSPSVQKYRSREAPLAELTAKSRLNLYRFTEVCRHLLQAGLGETGRASFPGVRMIRSCRTSVLGRGGGQPGCQGGRQRGTRLNHTQRRHAGMESARLREHASAEEPGNGASAEEHDKLRQRPRARLARNEGASVRPGPAGERAELGFWRAPTTGAKSVGEFTRGDQASVAVSITVAGDRTGMWSRCRHNLLARLGQCVQASRPSPRLRHRRGPGGSRA